MVSYLAKLPRSLTLHVRSSVYYLTYSTYVVGVFPKQNLWSTSRRNLILSPVACKCKRVVLGLCNVPLAKFNKKILSYKTFFGSTDLVELVLWNSSEFSGTRYIVSILLCARMLTFFSNQSSEMTCTLTLLSISVIMPLKGCHEILSSFLCIPHTELGYLNCYLDFVIIFSALVIPLYTQLYLALMLVRRYCLSNRLFISSHAHLYHHQE